MQPIGPLMIEHRLIEKMIALMAAEAERVDAGGEPDPRLIEAAVDFIRTYADRTHHGKEEDILFRDLAKKDLSDADRAAMDELVNEHVWARGKVAKLVENTQRWTAGEESARAEIVAAMKELTEFYPQHIAREDKVFFPAAMKYLSTEEQQAMIAEEYEFDRQMIHQKYKAVVEALSAPDR